MTESAKYGLEGVRVSTLASTAALLCLMTLSPTSLEAQGDGCPWCTTPTTCALVEEDTDLEGCVVNQENGCMRVSGECTVEVSMADPAALSDILGKHGITLRGVQTASVLGLPIRLAEVDHGLHLRWDCRGQVSAAFTRDPSGQWIEVDPRLYAREFSLRATSQEGVGLQ